jgi:hypothetical protein
MEKLNRRSSIGIVVTRILDIANEEYSTTGREVRMKLNVRKRNSVAII